MVAFGIRSALAGFVVARALAWFLVEDGLGAHGRAVGGGRTSLGALARDFDLMSGLMTPKFLRCKWLGRLLRTSPAPNRL